MPESVSPSPNRQIDPHLLGAAIQQSAGVDGWIGEPGQNYYAEAAGLDSPLDGFDADYSATSLSVTISTGEAFIGGTFLATDETTTVELDASTTNQTIYVGYAARARDTVKIGFEGIFTDEDGRIPAWQFTTNADGVTQATRVREPGPENAAGITSYSKSEANEQFYSRSEADSQFWSRSQANNRFVNRSGDTMSGTLTSNVSGSDAMALRFNMDRPYRFRQRETGGGTILGLQIESGGNEYQIENQSGEYISRYRGRPVGNDVTVQADTVIDAANGGPNGTIDLRGDIDLTGPVATSTNLTVSGDSIEMPNASGDAGLRLPDGTRWSQFQGWATAYTYSNRGGNGFRVRNPNGDGDLFTVGSVNGNGWING
jgi:hypothetical protein